jgi:tripartite-type tricarboxylate transporter receptor subunit TctC
MNKRSLLAAATALALAAATPWASAQTYPDKAIRLVVPFAVGGANDLVARVLSARLQANIKQAVVVENRPGAGGSVGVASVVKAAPDGYTLVLGESGSVSIGPSMSKKPPYDSVRDLVPVASIMELPLVIVANPGANIRNLKDLVAYGTGKNTSYGSAGTGTVQHLTMELLKRTMKLEMTHIPYRGGAPAMTDLIGGQFPFMPVSASTALQPVNANQIVTVAALGKNRSSIFPALSTAAEQGYPSLNVTVWAGIFAPTGTPPAIVEYLAAEVRKVLAVAETRKAITELGVDVVEMPRADFARVVQEDVRRWAQVIREGNLATD